MSDSDSDNENRGGAGVNLFGIALAGLGLGAAVYGVSKLLSSGSSEEPSELSRSGRGTRRPRTTDIIKKEYECTFLSNENILKVGVGIDIDKKKLQTDYGLQLAGIVDLRFIAKDYGYPTRKLRYLAEVIVEITLLENDHSNWNDDPLPQDCIEYAAMDVYASIEIMKKLVPSRHNVMNACLPYINKMFTTNMNNF